jgi:HPr kinase/phosphorylase
VIDVLRAYLSKHFADRTTMHGVFMDILGLGVLITGESGLGKSELGLELISRGNGLVADDAVDLYRINQTTIEGRCPSCCKTCWKCAASACWTSAHLWRDGGAAQDAPQAHRAPGAPRNAGARVRTHALRAADPGRAGHAGAQGGDSGGGGRNIAVLVEAAVRNTILQLRGIDTYQEFVERHRKAMGQEARLTTALAAAVRWPACPRDAPDWSGWGICPWCSGVQAQGVVRDGEALGLGDGCWRFSISAS